MFRSLFSSNKKYASVKHTEDVDWDDRDDDLQKEYGEVDDDDDSYDGEDDQIEMRGLISRDGNDDDIKDIRPVRKELKYSRAYHLGPINLSTKNVSLTFVLAAVCFTILFVSERERTPVTEKTDDYAGLYTDERLYTDDALATLELGDDFLKGNSYEVKRIAILGERNSGVNWFAKKVEQCFPDIEVTASLSRSSHWFQSQKYYDSSIPTVVMPVFLNPYDWVDTMRNFPRYMPAHMNMEWKDFVSKPWTMERPKRDMDLLKNSGNDMEKITCQGNFTYNEILSCVKGEGIPGDEKSLHLYNPMYELKVDGSGEAYHSILGLRAAKIHNLMSVVNWPNITLYLPVQYESLRTKGEFQYLINEIAQAGPRIDCDLTDPSFIAPKFWRGNLESEYLDWMKKNVNWDMEWSLGYDFFDAPVVKELINTDDKVEWMDPPESEAVPYALATIPPDLESSSAPASSPVKEPEEWIPPEGFFNNNDGHDDPPTQNETNTKEVENTQSAGKNNSPTAADHEPATLSPVSTEIVAQLPPKMSIDEDDIVDQLLP